MDTAVQSIIEISDRAKEELLKLEVNQENFLRLWVVEGGCKGYTYQAAIDNQFDSGDQVIWQSSEFRVVTDADSYGYLSGVAIDFSDDLAKGGFRFINPNASATCGCGSSFCG